MEPYIILYKFTANYKVNFSFFIFKNLSFKYSNASVRKQSTNVPYSTTFKFPNWLAIIILHNISNIYTLFQHHILRKKTTKKPLLLEKIESHEQLVKLVKMA